MAGRPPLFARRLKALWRRVLPQALPGPSGAAPRGRAARVHGFVDGCFAGEIRGWAVDPDQPGRRVHVIAVSEGRVVAETLADLTRADLVQAGRGDGRHGFRLRLPPALLDGEPRNLEVLAIAGGAPAPLKRGEVTLTAPPAEDLSGDAPRPRDALPAAVEAEEPAAALVLALWPGEEPAANCTGWTGEVVRLGGGADVAVLAGAHTVVFAQPGDDVAAETADLLSRSRPLADVITWDGAGPASRRPEARALGVRLGETLDGRFAIRGHVLTLAGAPLLEALRGGDARAAELCLSARAELRWAHLPARLTAGAATGRNPTAAAPGPIPERLSLAIWPGWSDAAAESLKALLEQAPEAAILQVLVAAPGVEEARALVAAHGRGAHPISVQPVDPPSGDTPSGWLAALAAAAGGEVAIICQAGVRLAAGLDEIAAWAGAPGVGAVTVPILGGVTPLAGLALKRTGEGWAATSAFSPELEARPRAVLAAPAAFLAVGRDRLAMLGGPADARLPLGGADLDLALRLRRLGLAGVLLGHLHAESTADVRPAGELRGPALAAFDPAELAAAAEAYPGAMSPALRLLGPRRPRVLALVDLVQDIDALLPVLLAIAASPDLSLKIVVSRWLQKESPRTEALLRHHGLGFSYVRRREIVDGRAPSLAGVGALLAASESSHPAHAAGHALALRAQGLGVKTYALQHGFEQIGLYGPEAAAARFASGTVFCWFAPEAAPADLPEQTRATLAPVGRPSPPGGWRANRAAAYELGVFENLHWDRYGEEDRTRFRDGLMAVARALPKARILLRPHPAGGWADQLGHELAAFQNIVRISAEAARGRLGGGAEILRGISRVITTPSTVALDSALAGIPVALAAAGGASYRPLPVLDGPEAWVAFASGEAYDPGVLDQFRSRVLVAGDGAPRIVERLGRDLVETMAKLS